MQISIHTHFIEHVHPTNLQSNFLVYTCVFYILIVQAFGICLYRNQWMNKHQFSVYYKSTVQFWL